MASAAKPLSYGFNVDPAFAAQADADAAVGQLAEEGRGLNAGDADGDVHNAFAIFFRGAGAHHVLMGNPEPGEPALALEAAERGAEQQHLGDRRRIKDIPGDSDGIGTREYELVRHFEGGGAERSVGEAPGVGKQGGVEAGGHLGVTAASAALTKR